MTMTMNAPTASTQAATILQRSVCVVLTRHYLGNYRKVGTGAVVEAAGGTAAKVDDSQFHSTKKLVPSQALLPVMRALEAAPAYLRGTAIPAHRVFGDRTYLLPIAAVQAAEERLVAIRTELLAQAALLAQRWPSLVDMQELALAPLGLFDRREYPTAADVATAFDLDWNYVSFAAPERLETVGRALFEGAQRKYESRMAEAYDEVRLVLRETLRQVTGEMVKKLTPGADGKPRVFRGTVLDDLAEFLATFDLRNIADDAELDGVVRQLRGLTDGLDVDQLRDLDGLRAVVLAGVKEATDALDALVATGRRGIRFSGDLA